jgi:hypothetical protein
MRRRPFIRPKKPVFFGCEGESEVAYGQVLNDLLAAASIPVHLQVEVLAPGAGDPLARVQRTLGLIIRREKQRVRFPVKAILMDSDQARDAPDRLARGKQLAREAGILIIWQKPCHEAVLLRHMPDCSTRRPLTCNTASQALVKVWPEYEKPMSRARLASRVDLAAIQQAASVEPQLRAFLQDIGLLP